MDAATGDGGFHGGKVTSTSRADEGIDGCCVVRLREGHGGRRGDDVKNNVPNEAVVQREVTRRKSASCAGT